MRSIALSGRNLSVIYLSDNFTASMIAESLILIPWCTSYLSLRPRRMLMVSSIDGSFTIIGWNRLSRAGSFSIYFLYSFMVVAPIHFRTPLASIGLRRFPASIEPSDEPPAPTTVCSSSINIIISPLLDSTSLRRAFNLSSNSPLNFAPAINAPISTDISLLCFKVSGTSPFTILWARPSMIAVLPTPGSPISTGLFFVLLLRTCIILLTSVFLPITGSSLPSLASFVKSTLYFSRTLYFSSASSESNFALPLMSFKAIKTDWVVTLRESRIFVVSDDLSSRIASKICSFPINVSPKFCACTAALSKTRFRAGEINICPLS